MKGKGDVEGDSKRGGLIICETERIIMKSMEVKGLRRKMRIRKGKWGKFQT